MEILDDRSVIYQLEVYKKWYEEQQEEIEKLKNESKEISKQHIATLDKLIEKQTKIENVIEYIKENGYIDLNGYDLLKILGGDE